MEYFSAHKCSVISLASNVPGYETPIALIARPEKGITPELIVKQFVILTTAISKTAGDLYMEEIAGPYVKKLDEMIAESLELGMKQFAKKCMNMKNAIERYAYELPVTFFNFVSWSKQCKYMFFFHYVF